jgi:hypothetical protein
MVLLKKILNGWDLRYERANNGAYQKNPSRERRILFVRNYKSHQTGPVCNFEHTLSDGVYREMIEPLEDEV